MPATASRKTVTVPDFLVDVIGTTHDAAALVVDLLDSGEVEEAHKGMRLMLDYLDAALEQFSSKAAR